MSACRSDHGSPADPSNTDQDASARPTATEAYSDVLAPNEVQMRNVSMVTIHSGYLYYPQKIDLGLTSAHIIRKRNLETGEISSPLHRSVVLASGCGLPLLLRFVLAPHVLLR